MNLTPEQMDQGRRNFLRVLAGTPAVAALGVTAALRGPVPGGPVRVGFLCVGSQGRTLLSNVDPAYAQVVALCDINPTSLARADEVLKNNGQPPAKHYEDWKEMLQKENIEAVIMAPPLWMHAELAAGCLEAGKHVLCEKPLAISVEEASQLVKLAGETKLRNATFDLGDFLNQAPLTTPVQFLVFNEFEQRFSTSRRVTCFQEFTISDIDTHTPTKSIFSAAVNGTLTGQTRMRGVADQDTTHGHALLGVAEEFRTPLGSTVASSSAAFNLHFTGSRPQSDFVYLP